jgi:hypothetical protein
MNSSIKESKREQFHMCFYGDNITQMLNAERDITRKKQTINKYSS